MNKKIISCLVTLMILLPLVLPVFADNTAKGLYVNSPTQEEITRYIKNNQDAVNKKIMYDEEPDTTPGSYKPGKLSEDSLGAGLKMLQNIRFVAGLNDNVELDEKYCEYAQAGALVNAANNSLSHDPDQPENMSDELYSTGRYGTRHSNLAWGGPAILSQTVLLWMSDGDDDNRDRVGHRRYQLDPSLIKVGFGAVGSYFAEFVLGERSESAVTGVAWPAQNTPVKYFYAGDPWSVSTGNSEDLDAVRVTLKNKKTAKTWTFYNGCDENSSNSGYFNVDNGGYGQSGCIIFQPNEITCNEGDSFHVLITGASREIEYDVAFFDAEPKEESGIEDLWLDKSSMNLVVGETGKLEATVIPQKGSDGGAKTVTWETSDNSVASVSNGIVIAKKEGAAVITASIGDQSTACYVTVTDKQEADTVRHGINCPSTEYSDVSKSESDWTHLPIDYVLEKGYMAGIGNGKFDPNGTVTRAQIVQMLYAKEGKPSVKDARNFRDVPTGQWYSNAVEWASSKSIVAGYSDGTFKPRQPVTREQLVTIMYAFARYEGKDISASGSLDSFRDAGNVSNYAKTPMRWAVGNTIISGTGSGLEPGGASTRAQIAVILRAYDRNVN